MPQIFTRRFGPAFQGMEITFDHNPNDSALNPKIDITMDLLWYSQETMMTACAGDCSVNLTGVPEGENASDHNKGYLLDMGINFALPNRDELTCNNTGHEGTSVCYDAVVGHMVGDAKN